MHGFESTSNPDSPVQNENVGKFYTTGQSIFLAIVNILLPSNFKIMNSLS